MKKLIILFTLMLLIYSSDSSAKRVQVFGNVAVNIEDVNENPVWVRENDKQPKYPYAMAIANLRGCAVISFDVNPLGRIENLKVVSAIPNKKIASEARIAIRKWKWVNLKNNKTDTVESKVARIDYCIGGDSAEQSKKLCQQQAARQCK